MMLISIKAMKPKEFPLEKEFLLESFKKINYDNSQIILQNLINIMENIKKDLKLIINTMNQEHDSYIRLSNIDIDNDSDSHIKSIGYIIKSTIETDYMINNILNRILEFQSNLQFKGDNFDYINNLKELYAGIIRIFEYSFENEKIISAYLYEKEHGIQIEDLKQLNDLIILNYDGEKLMSDIENNIIKNIKEFKYLNQKSCSEMINKLNIMLNTNNVIEVLINLESGNEFFKISDLIYNIIDFQAKILKYKYPIESEIKIPLKIIKYNDITKKIEDSIIDNLDLIVINYLNDSQKIKIIERILKYKKFFKNINRNIEIYNSTLKNATLENSTLENNDIERITLKDYISKKKEIFFENFIKILEQNNEEKVLEQNNEEKKYDKIQTYKEES